MRHLKATALSAAMLLAMGGFAMAQTAAPQPGAAGAAPGTQMGATAGATAQLDAERVKQKLGEIGVEQLAEFQGSLVKARTAEGHTVFMAIGPENLAGDQQVDLQFAELQGKLTQAGFQDVQIMEEARLVRGEFEGNAVLAMATDERGLRGPDAAAAPTAPGVAAGAATPPATGEVDKEQLKSKLGEAGFEDAAEVQGKLIHARTMEGQHLVMVIGPRDFERGEIAELDAQQVQERFQQAGLQDVEVIEEDFSLIRASLDDKTVLAASGTALFDMQAGVAR